MLRIFLALSLLQGVHSSSFLLGLGYLEIEWELHLLSQRIQNSMEFELDESLAKHLLFLEEAIRFKKYSRDPSAKASIHYSLKRRENLWESVFWEGKFQALRVQLTVGRTLRARKPEAEMNRWSEKLQSLGFQTSLLINKEQRLRVLKIERLERGWIFRACLQGWKGTGNLIRGDLVWKKQDSTVLENQYCRHSPALQDSF